MWVVKLGGSLAAGAELAAWLARLTPPAAAACVIVPGGGAFADQVRAHQAQWRFADMPAHRMAILAMAQYGIMLCALEPRLRAADSLRALWPPAQPRDPVVWIPTLADVAALSALPANWTVSADSIALWLAGRLAGARLLLVKSARAPAGNAAALAAAGYLDAHFPDLLVHTAIPAYWLAKSEAAVFDSAWRAAPDGSRRIDI